MVGGGGEGRGGLLWAVWMEGGDKDFCPSTFQFLCVPALFYLEYTVMVEIEAKLIYSEEMK